MTKRSLISKIVSLLLISIMLSSAICSIASTDNKKVDLLIGKGVLRRLTTKSRIFLKSEKGVNVESIEVFKADAKLEPSGKALVKAESKNLTESSIHILNLEKSSSIVEGEYYCIVAKVDGKSQVLYEFMCNENK